jgi:tRNA(Ile)-lysidine synthase
VLSELAGSDFARLFSRFDFASRPCVTVAVSGGSDSTALLLLLKDHLQQYAPDTRLVAITIDHGLRLESSAEADEVARLCARLGVAHVIRTWKGAKPATGLPAAAREARHELLAQAAAELESDLVVMGHTADDQAETVLMRGAREAGRGLAGMAPATLYDGRTWFVRPMLAARRQDLRDYLRQRGLGWIDDPSNASEKYERPRVRKRLGAAGGERDLAAALDRASDAASQRERFGEAAATFITEHVTRPAPGLLRVDQAAFDRLATDVALYPLRILLATAGGTPHLPDQSRTSALRDRLRTDRPVRAVLSRALVDRRNAGIFLLREARNLPGAAAMKIGAIWDGRYRLVAKAEETERRSASAAAGHSGLAPVPESLAKAALSREPAHLEGQQGAGWVQAVPVVAPWARFLPSFDLAPARAVGSLIGAPKIPASPFRQHIGAKP